MPLNKQSLVNGSKRILGSSAGQVGLILISVLCAFWFGTCQTEDEWKKKYDDYRTAAQEAATHYADSMNAIVNDMIAGSNSIKKETDSLKQTVTQLSASNKKLRDSIKVISPIRPGELPVSCDPCRVRLDSAIVEIAKRDTIISNQDRIISTQARTMTRQEVRIILLEGALRTQRVTIDSLTKIIIEMPKPPSPPKLAGFINLGPTESFLVGVGVGLITAVAVSN